MRVAWNNPVNVIYIKSKLLNLVHTITTNNQLNNNNKLKVKGQSFLLFQFINFRIQYKRAD